MAHYFDSTDMSTKDLLDKVSELTLGYGQRAMFLAPNYEPGHVVTQRMRVKLSKTRAKWDLAGTPYYKYSLRQDIFTIHERGTGKRRDVIVMWVDRRTMHEADELLQDLLTAKAKVES